MKFKDKDGNVLVDIQAARAVYCRGKTCENCPIDDNKHGKSCDVFVGKYPLEAARIMGYEIIGEVKNPCIGCEAGWGCSDGSSCTDNCERFAEYLGYLENLEPCVVEQDAQEAKSDAGKPRPSLVPVSLIEAVTAIREYGCQKSITTPRTGGRWSRRDTGMRCIGIGWRISRERRWTRKAGCRTCGIWLAMRRF